MQIHDTNSETIFRTGEHVYGTNNDKALSGWALTSGSHFVPHGLEHQIDMTGPTEAVWNCSVAADYTIVFSFKIDYGTGCISLQRSGKRGEISEYRVQFDILRFAIVRISHGEAQELASAPIQLSSSHWHTVCIESCGGWKRVTIDYRKVLKVEDPQPLPAGTQGFCAMEDSRFVFANVHLTQWAQDDANQIRKIIESFDGKFKPFKKPNPTKAHLPPQLRVVPFETAVFRYVFGGPQEYDRDPVQINPGDIPPNFLHTWILDLKGIEAFHLYFASHEDIMLHKEDRVSIYNLQGLKSNPPQPLASFTSFATAAVATVDISMMPYDKVRMGSDFKRLYVQLETSPEYVQRRFIVNGLTIDHLPTGREEALLFGDDIDYSSVIIAVELNKQGIPKQIPAPWVPGWYTHYNNIPLPNQARGWYLIAKHLTSPDESFYSLVYYNEQLSKLRLYLYNLDMPINVTGATVTISLERFTSENNENPYGGRTPLSGAFFSLHPNPNRWSSAEIPLFGWGPGTWACVEVPMLYPMADNAPVDISKAVPLPPLVNYRSLYEEPLLKGLRGILLKLHIDTYEFGEIDGTLTGQAVGEAIEMISQQQPGFFDILKTAGGTAGDIFKNGYEIYKNVKDFYNKTIANPPKDMSTFQFLSNIVSVGASAFSGVGSIVSAALSLTNFLVGIFGGDPKLPLRMSIMLELNAKFKGQLKIQHHLGPSVAFYLPGRFAIDEAVHLGLFVDDPDVTAHWAPRYDRTMGLFGYRYELSEVIFPLLREEEGHGASRLSTAFATHPFLTVKFEPSKITAPVRDDIERLLPIVYNSFAEITPMTPIVVKSDTEQWPFPTVIHDPSDVTMLFNLDAGLIFTKWFFDVSWITHVTPESDDMKFPPDVLTEDSEHGPCLFVRVRFHDDCRAISESTIYFWGAFEYEPTGLHIQVSPNRECVPQTYRNFKNIKYVKIMQNYYYRNVLERRDDNWNWIPIINVTDTYPYDNVLYFWDIPYFYYARSRKTNGLVPSLRWTARMCGPVMLHITTASCSYDSNSQTWNELKKYQLIPSKLLEP